MSDFSTTTENKTLKKEQTDNYSINSSHNSNNNKNTGTKMMCPLQRLAFL